MVVGWHRRHGVSEAPQTCQSLFHWLQLLSKMPQLTSITITRSILRDVSLLPPKSMVSLPNLRLLDLSETSQDVSLMLDRIRFPTSSPCKMQLFCDDSVVNFKETASIIGVFTQNLEYQALAGRELNTLKLKQMAECTKRVLSSASVLERSGTNRRYRGHGRKSGCRMS